MAASDLLDAYDERGGSRSYRAVFGVMFFLTFSRICSIYVLSEIGCRSCLQLRLDNRISIDTFWCDGAEMARLYVLIFVERRLFVLCAGRLLVGLGLML